MAAVKTLHWGGCPQARPRSLRCVVLAWSARNIACLIAVIRVAAAQPAATTPVDPPAAAQPVTVPPSTLPPSWDLDGTYLWLGPVGAASHIDARWDSTFGAEAAVVVVHERARLGLAGVTLGASRWTARGGGRMWVDGLIGMHIGHMMGLSLGPILELSELAHPRPGASVGVWCFAGVTPFARLGTVSNLGMFAEVGIHIALPVLRR